MHAHDRFLPQWFDRIRNRQMTLPRFQRFESWGHNEVAGLLTTVLRGLPSGAALILEVGDEEQFPSRPLAGAPSEGDRVTEQLLDGQQRLTALWRSMHDNYDDRTYLVWFDHEDEEDELPDDQYLGGVPTVYGQTRWERNGRKYPAWVDDSSECWERGYIPLRLLRPGDIQGDIDQWVNGVIAPLDDSEKLAASRRLDGAIRDLRTRVREFNLPYLSLPVTTTKDVALDVFVKMNTSSVKLTVYDITVALVEASAGESLSEHVERLVEQVPRVEDYVDPHRLVLDIAALHQNRSPSKAGHLKIDGVMMIRAWDEMIESVRGVIGLLESECIFDERRLPSYPPIPVVAAAWRDLPDTPDDHGNARRLLRKYLWRSFLTDRYEQASTTSSLQDFRALKTAILARSDGLEVPIFDEGRHPLPTVEELIHAEWPKKKSVLGRAILALQLRCGAIDFADEREASIASIASPESPREYHHLFPESILVEAGVPRRHAFRALNCALITWRTNRTISNKDPIRYLQERADNGTMGESEVRRRLRSHLIPFDELSVGYDGLEDAERRISVEADYETFLAARAKLIERAARLAADGARVDVAHVFEGN